MNEKSIIKYWGTTTLQSVKSRYISLIRSSNRSGEGLDSIKIRYKESYGEIDQVNFKFDRHLIFVHKGAGKGVGGSKGTSWISAKGVRKKTAASSLNKIGTGKRKSKLWLNPVLDAAVPKLADQLTEIKIEHALKAIDIK